MKHRDCHLLTLCIDWYDGEETDVTPTRSHESRNTICAKLHINLGGTNDDTSMRKRRGSPVIAIIHLDKRPATFRRFDTPNPPLSITERSKCCRIPVIHFQLRSLACLLPSWIGTKATSEMEYKKEG